MDLPPQAYAVISTGVRFTISNIGEASQQRSIVITTQV